MLSDPENLIATADTYPLSGPLRRKFLYYIQSLPTTILIEQSLKVSIASLLPHAWDPILGDR